VALVLGAVVRAGADDDKGFDGTDVPSMAFFIDFAIASIQALSSAASLAAK